MCISSHWRWLFEGFAWRATTWIGIGLSVAGNVVILRRRA